MFKLRSKDECHVVCVCVGSGDTLSIRRNPNFCAKRNYIKHSQNCVLAKSHRVELTRMNYTVLWTPLLLQPPTLTMRFWCCGCGFLTLRLFIDTCVYIYTIRYSNVNKDPGKNTLYYNIYNNIVQSQRHFINIIKTLQFHSAKL